MIEGFGTMRTRYDRRLNAGLMHIKRMLRRNSGV